MDDAPSRPHPLELSPADDPTVDLPVPRAAPRIASARPRHHVFVAVAAVAVLVVGVFVAASRTSSVPHEAPPNGIAPVLPAGVKPLIVGLIDKGSGFPYHNDVPFPVVDLAQVQPDAAGFAGIVANATWAQIEPEPGQFNYSIIDQDLALVNAYNRKNPANPLEVKLRVWPALTAPEWAKVLSGPPIPITPSGTQTKSGTVGRWWTPAYRSAWSVLQHNMAARYDNNPLVHEVSVSSCASLTDEPFNMAATPAEIQQVIADGWSTQAQRACLSGALADYSGWRHTAVEFPFNPSKSITPTGQISTSTSFTATVMRQCAGSDTGAHAGPYCILSNHGLAPNDAGNSAQAPIYQELSTLTKGASHAAVGLQSISPSNAGLCQAIANAVSHNAESVELWAPAGAFPGFTTIPVATLAAWNHALRSRTLPHC
jgi:hypothetical protein